MFGEEFTNVPIVQVSIDSSLSPEKHWALGKAVAKLRFGVPSAFCFGSYEVFCNSGRKEYLSSLAG